jgi:hypothetical protein
MTEIYLTGNTSRGHVRFRFEADGLTIQELVDNLESLQFLRTVGGPANDPILITGIRPGDALMGVLVGANPVPDLSDRIGNLTGYTIISNANQIEISIDTSGLELLVVWFADLLIQQLPAVP